MAQHALPAADPLSVRSPSGKKFRSKPQLARYLGGSMDLSTFDFRTGKMLLSKMSKSRQRVRYDSSNQVKVSSAASVLGHATLDFGVLSSRPVLGIQVTFFKKSTN